jgi:hypothetical protein
MRALHQFMRSSDQQIPFGISIQACQCITEQACPGDDLPWQNRTTFRTKWIG